MVHLLTIKSHHNVGGLPKKMHLKLVEPLRFLFKDEVRKVGRELGIPTDLLTGIRFPGPGLAIRILGEVTEEKVRLLQEADDIYVKALKDHQFICNCLAGRRHLTAGEKCGCNGR